MTDQIDISIIITAWKEPRTIGPLVSTITSQIQKIKNKKFKVLLVCPDEETRIAGLNSDKYGLVQWVKDEQKGKPLALNNAFRLAKGAWCITTDGDVLWNENALEQMVDEIENKKNWGAVSGHPVPVNSRNNLFGFWAHLLTEMAHRQRLDRVGNGRFIVCSGYLMAIRKDLFEELPSDVLSDDALISYVVNKKNQKIGYAKNALVLVKFPENLKDWIKQKARSGGGYAQLSKFIEIPKDVMRSFKNELLGIFDVFLYAKNVKELYWTALLIFARAYLWLKIFWERKIINKSFSKTWVRIESTK